MAISNPLYYGNVQTNTDTTWPHISSMLSQAVYRGKKHQWAALLTQDQVKVEQIPKLLISHYISYMVYNKLCGMHAYVHTHTHTHAHAHTHMCNDEQ